MFYKILFSFSAIFLLSACATVETPSTKMASLSSSPGAAPSGISHVIQNGETLWRISQNYHVDLEDILKANKLNDSTHVMTGQTIIIPTLAKNRVLTTTNFGPQDFEGDFIWPVQGKITEGFKQRIDGISNKGINIRIDSTENIKASCSGKVVFADSLTGYGPTVIIDHQNGFSTVYCGISDVNVKLGDHVPQGGIIAKAGDPFKKGYNLLHFELRKQHRPQNPLYYLTD